MRVLLHESGESGHRAVYRDYYEAACRSGGADVQVYSGPPFNGLFGFNQDQQGGIGSRNCRGAWHASTLMQFAQCNDSNR